jgi:hypothetical protein
LLVDSAEVVLNGFVEIGSNSSLTVSNDSTLIIGSAAVFRGSVYLDYGDDVPNNHSAIDVQGNATFNGALVVYGAIDANSTTGTIVTVATYGGTDGSQFSSISFEASNAADLAPCERVVTDAYYSDRRLELLISLDTSACAPEAQQFPPWAIAVASVGGAVVIVSVVLAIVFGNKKCRKAAMPYQGTTN